jgi:hypothetical protein
VDCSDLDSRDDLPPIDALISWLDRAVGFLGERLRAADPTAPEPLAWVEAALGTELLADDLGVRAVRTRRRAWAMALFRGRALPDAPERPRFLAAREFAALDAGTWAEDIDEAPGAARLPERPPALPWVLTPEAAATVVPFLAAFLHPPGTAPGQRVGSGWCIADDPFHERGLVGGSFDDVGFPASHIPLAEAGVVLRGIEGQGTWRRPSYRDRPAFHPSTLVLDPPDVGRPESFYRVRAIRIHGMAPDRWLLEVDGVRRNGDADAEVFQGARAIVAPASLAAACVGGIGSARAAGWGVVTPGLIFEGLRLE